MKRKFGIITAVKLMLAAVLVISVVNVVRQQQDYRAGDVSYTNATATAGIELPAVDTTAAPTAEQSAEEVYHDPVADALAATDLGALRAVNPDVIGWICIPDTVIHYPIVQGGDNDYYLYRTWEGQRNSVGSIFLECQVSPDLTDFNTIVYGHKMRNDSMFGSLEFYADPAYWLAHPSVYLVTDAGVQRYDIYATYEAEVDALTFGLGITGEETKNEFIAYGIAQSELDTGIVPTAADRILTLSTCTGRGYASRRVVQAVLNNGTPAWMEWKVDS